MSKNSEGLIADFLDDRWTHTNAAAMGATVNGGTSAPTNAKFEMILDTFSYSIRNQATGAHTCTMQIRDASVAGTVLHSWDEFPAAASSAVRHFEGLKLIATAGKGFHFTMDSIIASVRATVNATGWIKKTNTY